jgi:hypothetical protein
MRKSTSAAFAVIGSLGLAGGQPAAAAPFFSTGTPDGKIATATRPAAGSPFEIESADDFILTQPTTLTSATFTGLVPTGSLGNDVKGVVVEIYRVFPADSDVGRTSGPSPPSPPPGFSTPQVPTRLNSPSDMALVSRDSNSPGELTFTTTTLMPGFTADNSVQPGGIHPKPGQKTGGDGPVTGDEVEYDVTFTDPITLGPDHYFFVPQVLLDTTGTLNGDFLWLSAPKPITGGTGPFVGDLQSWTRDAMLDPDWLRVGTDIVGAGAFNAAFSLTGIVPEPGTLAVLGTGLLGLVLLGRPRSRR